MTATELAHRIRRPQKFALETLTCFEQAGLVEEHDGNWCLTDRGRRQLSGFASIFAELEEATRVGGERGIATERASTPKRVIDPRLMQPRCQCGCGEPISMERYLGKHAFAEGHKPARKLSPREKLRREREADADAKPVTSTCSRCGATFGPGPVSVVREAFKEHACEVAA